MHWKVQGLQSPVLCPNKASRHFQLPPPFLEARYHFLSLISSFLDIVLSFISTPGRFLITFRSSYETPKSQKAIDVHSGTPYISAILFYFFRTVLANFRIYKHRPWVVVSMAYITSNALKTLSPVYLAPSVADSHLRVLATPLKEQEDNRFNTKLAAKHIKEFYLEMCQKKRVNLWKTHPRWDLHGKASWTGTTGQSYSTLERKKSQQHLSRTGRSTLERWCCSELIPTSFSHEFPTNSSKELGSMQLL